MPLGDDVLDNGLTRLDTLATDIVICSALPTTYAEANATFALGRKVFGAGGCFGAPAAATPNGRKVTSAAITDGAVATSGTASHWGAIDTVNTRLGAAYTLASSQAVTAGNSFAIPAFDVRVPNQ
jgi:hypothetical protein